MRKRVRRSEYERINRMLDEADAGNYKETDYDESELSKLESKWQHHLTRSRIAAERVEQEQAKLKELVTDISHQTRTPLSNILLYAELLKERGLDAESHKMVEQILLHTQKLEFLIQSLVMISRLESGTFQLVPRTCNLASLTEAVCVNGRDRAKAREIPIVTEAHAHPDVAVLCDRKWTEEALSNILDNAIKYSPAGGRVTVREFSYEMFAGIEIADEGIGIPEEEIPRIFARFYRGSNAREDEGVGVGLFLARQIVEAEGGYIKVMSGVGEGSRFSVFLPRVIAK